MQNGKADEWGDRMADQPDEMRMRVGRGVVQRKEKGKREKREERERRGEEQTRNPKIYTAKRVRNPRRRVRQATGDREARTSEPLPF